MRVLMISKEGDGLGVAHKLTQQGHEVLAYVKDPKFTDALKGIIRRIDSWREGLSECDLVICDMVGFGQYEKTLRTLGKPTISCSYILEQAEIDRVRGMELFRSCDIEIPETYACVGPSEAKATIEQAGWDKGWVLKPCGNAPAAKTLMVHDSGELDYGLSIMPGGKMIVQKVVEGIEVSTEGWYNGRGFLRPFNHTFEEKRFLVDDLGPATGCMGNVVFAAPSNRLTRATVEKLGKFLSVIGYHGPVDVNCIVTEKAAYALEISARMGYDAVETLIEGLREPIIDLFFEVAQGTKKEMKVTKDAMIGVRLSTPPWPHAKTNEEAKGIPIQGLSEEVLKHVALCDVYKKDGKFLTAGGDGILLKATATGAASGDDLTREAQRRVYRTLENIKVAGKQYRTDIGDRVNDDMKQLRQWGWL